MHDLLVIIFKSIDSSTFKLVYIKIMLLFKTAHNTLFTVSRVTGFNSFVQKLNDVKFRPYMYIMPQ